uniref:RNase H type-1 domain-containing protein n=2 Tax=Triticum urartu TaxID=4572 RepID=A0A8R7VAZ7_TRIUA
MWTKPSRNTYKLNVDASFSENGTGGAGAVLRNDRGEALAGACWPLHNIFDAATAEATALQKGLSLIEGLQCVPVTVETDSLELVEAFNGTIQIWSPYAAVLADCFQIASRIGSISVHHCNREVNYVAHNLVKHAFVSNSTIFWDDVPPRFIVSDVMNDVSLFVLQ